MPNQVGFALPQSGELYYNGVTFSVASKITATYEPVMDPLGQSTEYVKVTISVEDIAGPASLGFPKQLGKTDDQVLGSGIDEIASRLTTASQRLRMLDKGAVTLDVGPPDDTYPDPGIHQDLLFGPEPKILEWEPIGDNIAVRIRWRVTTHLPIQCIDLMLAGYSFLDASLAQRLRYFKYSVSWEIDNKFVSRRTVSGEWKVWVTLASMHPDPAPPAQPLPPNAPDFTADQLRDQLVVALPLGWRRVNQKFDLSEDFSKMQFSITDEEVPSRYPYHENAIDISANQTVSAAAPFYGKIVGSISATITPRFTAHPAEAYRIFMLLVNARLRHVPRLGSIHEVDEDGNVTEKNVALVDSPRVQITRFEWSEEIFNNTSSFSIAYFYKTSLTSLLLASGLWRPIKFEDGDALGFDWQLWQNAQGSSVGQGVRGHADQRLFATDIDANGLGSTAICDFLANSGSNEPLPEIPAPTNGEANDFTAIGTQQQTDDFLRTTLKMLGMSQPAPELSWVIHNSSLEVATKNESMQHQPLGAPIIPTVSPGQPTNGQLAEITDTETNLVQNGVPSLVQSIAGPTTIKMAGFAVRLGHRIPVPRIIQVGGQAVTPIASRTKARILTVLGGGDGTFDPTDPTIQGDGIPVHQLEWELEYAVTQAPGTQPYPDYYDETRYRAEKFGQETV